MNGPTRLMAVVPVVGGLILLSAHAFELGVAGTVVFDASLATSLWSTTGRQPSVEVLDAISNKLVEAKSRLRNAPAVHELLGMVTARRGTGAEYAHEANVHFVKAAELRPTSPYTWANIAAVRYRLAATGREFEAALEHATMLGLQEPDVQRTVANFGLAVWDETGPTTRTAVKAAVAAGMKRNPLEMLQIAERRGRLAVPCRHLSGSSRQADSKWVQLCQSMEATS